MIKKLVLFLMSVAVLFTLFVGCGEDKNLDGTTGNDTTNITQNETEDVFLDIEEETTFPNIDTLTLPEYNSMSVEEQKVVMDAFETTDAFFEWYNEKVQDYENYVEQQKNPTESTVNNEITESTTPYVSVPGHDELTFLDYHSLSGDEQLAFINSFNSYKDFVSWYSAAKQEYYDSMIEIDGSTPIDLGDLIGGT